MLPELKSKPTKKIAIEDWGKYTMKSLLNIEKLRYGASLITPEDVKRAHDKVDWKKVNGAKDNKAIQRHRMQKIYAFKDGVLVGEYESQMEAGRQLGIPQGNIRGAIDNNRIRKGYTFRSTL